MSFWRGTGSVIQKNQIFQVEHGFPSGTAIHVCKLLRQLFRALSAVPAGFYLTQKLYSFARKGNGAVTLLGLWRPGAPLLMLMTKLQCLAYGDSPLVKVNVIPC